MHQRREVLSLEGIWEFAPGHQSCDNIYSYSEDNESIPWTKEEVPGFWNGSKGMSILGEYYSENGYYKDHKIPPFRDHYGVGWYRKQFKLTQDWNGKRIHLRFYSVAAKAVVWVNGSYAGEHLGAYSAFEFDITEYIRYSDENRLVVQVFGKRCFYPFDQRIAEPGKLCIYEPGRVQEIMVGETRDNAGICQPVQLYATEHVYIGNLEVQTDKDSLKACVVIERKQASRMNVKLCLRLVQKGTGKLVREEVRESELPESTNHYTFVWKSLYVVNWCPENPSLYQLEAVILSEKKKLDSGEKIIGFKEFKINENKFYLNGKPYFLRCAGTPPHTMIVWDEAYIAKFLKLCKEININCIRFHTEPPSEAWLRGCDEAGFLVIYEMALMQQLPEVTNTRREFRELVRQSKHHASLGIYCISNEITHLDSNFDRAAGAAGYNSMSAYMSDLREAVLSEDCTLPVYGDAGSRYGPVEFEIRDFHHYHGWYNGPLHEFTGVIRDEESNSSSNKPVAFTEFMAAYTADDGRFYQYPAKVRKIGKYPDPDNKKALWYQAFLLKELVEMMRSGRNEKNRISLLSPFALLNWFHYPLDMEKISYKSAALALKSVYEPAHVSINCWSRHVFGKDSFRAEIRLIHDDVSKAVFINNTVVFSIKTADERTILNGSLSAANIGYYEVGKIPLYVDIPEIDGTEIVEAVLRVA